MKRLYVILLFTLIFSLTGHPAYALTDNAVIQEGSQVVFDYTLSIDGQVVETSEEKEPFRYTQGDGQVIPGLARQLEGLRQGDKRTIVVSPEEAYGMVDPNAFQEILKTKLPPDVDPQVGLILQVSNAQGATRLVRIVQVKEDSVVIDFNHPFAGKTLTFKVKIISVD